MNGKLLRTGNALGLTTTLLFAATALGCTNEVTDSRAGGTRATWWARTDGAPSAAPSTAATATPGTNDAGAACDKEKFAPKPALATPVSIVTPGAAGLGTAATPDVADGAPVTTAADWDRLARTRLAAGDDIGARVAALQATARGPESAGAWNTLGRAHLKLGALREAAAAFTRAVELNPLSSHAHNNLGLVLLYQGEFEAAARELEMSVGLAPVEPYMWNNLGMALEHLGRVDDARDAYREGADMGSKLAAANLARIADRTDPAVTEDLEWIVDPVPALHERDELGDPD
jgi:Flp pilus assembly protein TadD